jgi:hypothetical protein
MKTGRPDTNRVPIRRAMAECNEPLGATHAWLVERTGMDPALLKQTTYKMNKDGHLWSVMRYGKSHYFATPEARDAAEPAVLEHFKAEAVAQALKTLQSRRARDRARSARRVAQQRARRERENEAKRRRYAEQAEVRAATKARVKASREAKKAAKKAGEAKVEKPANPKRPKFKDIVIAKPKPVKTEDAARLKWADQPAIIPPSVKVQRLPGCPVRTRFEPPAWFRGEWLAEWRELRTGLI